MASIIQLRRDIAVNWTSADPILAQGEIGIETDTLRLKIGDGTTVWTLLPYYETTGVDAVNGSIFIYDLVPNTGNIDITYAENNVRVDSALADSSVTEITVHVFAYTGHSNVRPNAIINGENVTWSTAPNQTPTAYLGEATLTISTGTITATHEDGAEHSVVVTGDVNPQITSLEFTGGYPGTQTELKEDDTFDINVVSDLDFVKIEVENSGACKSQIVNVSATNTHTFSANIADRGTTAQDLPARVRVQKSTGAWSDWVYTNDSGSVDGTNTVKVNNLYPSVETMNQTSITYPVSQEAIKGSESATIHSTCSDFDVISYSSPNSQLSITSDTTYEENKDVSRIAGGYNITTNNYRISATRNANNATTTKHLVVYIANDAADITMSEPASRLRTGGNDGTSVQNHTITLTSNQELLSTPTIADPPVNAGSWSGSFSGGPTIYTRTLQCHDDDEVGSYSYGALSATNLAGIETTTYTGNSTYTIGGFVSRDISLAAFANESTFNAAVSDYTKCTLSWSFKSLPNRRAFNTTTTPDANSWCFAGTLNSSPTTARILDTAATAASSNETTITIEETV